MSDNGLNRMIQLLRDIASGMENGKITFVPEMSHVETVWSSKSYEGKGNVMSGWFKLSLLYYDKERDATIGLEAINLKIHDGTLGNKDDLKP